MRYHHAVAVWYYEGVTTNCPSRSVALGLDRYKGLLALQAVECEGRRSSVYAKDGNRKGRLASEKT